MIDDEPGVPLREHLEAGTTELEKRLMLAINALTDRMLLTFEMNRIAIDKAETKMESRLSAMNEFREALKDQASQFFTRKEFEILHHKLEEDVVTLRNNLSNLITRGEADIIHAKIEEDTQHLLQAQARVEGKASMNAVYVAYVFAALGIFLGILELVHQP